MKWERGRVFRPPSPRTKQPIKSLDSTGGGGGEGGGGVGKGGEEGGGRGREGGES